MRYLEGGVTYFSCLLTEDRAKQPFLSRKLCFSLRGNLSYQNISCTDFSSDTDDAALVKVLKRIVTNARHITGYLLRPELCITGFCFIFLDMY